MALAFSKRRFGNFNDWPRASDVGSCRLKHCFAGRVRITHRASYKICYPLYRLEVVKIFTLRLEGLYFFAKLSTETDPKSILMTSLWNSSASKKPPSRNTKKHIIAFDSNLLEHDSNILNTNVRRLTAVKTASWLPRWRPVTVAQERATVTGGKQRNY